MSVLPHINVQHLALSTWVLITPCHEALMYVKYRYTVYIILVTKYFQFQWHLPDLELNNCIYLINDQ